MNGDGTTFGTKLRETRDAAGISLRELANAANVSAAFLSDVELGRRFPKDETLQAIAKHLQVSVDMLKMYDHRTALADLKRYADQTPSLGAAIRLLVEKVNSGAIPPSELASRLKRLSEPSDQ